MNLISCNSCGVVLNKDKLAFPEGIYGEDGSVNASIATWDGGRFVAFVKCPVCSAEILRSQEG